MYMYSVTCIPHNYIIHVLFVLYNCTCTAVERTNGNALTMATNA